MNFENTVQKQDLTKGHFKDEGTGTFPYRCKVNTKGFDPELRAAKGLPPFNFKDRQAVLDEMKNEFDISHWFLAKAGDLLENIFTYDMPMIYQVKGCNFHQGGEIDGCVPCYVDNESNSGNPDKGVYLSVKNIVDSFQRMNKERGTKVIRTSGGEPTLVLEHLLALYKELESRGVKPILAQFDTNLSTGHLIDHLEKEGILEKNILGKIAEYDPKLLVAFKGTSDESIRQNIQAVCSVEEQTYSLKKIVEAGLDVYPYIYNPDPETFEGFIGKLQETFPNILPRIHIGLLKMYSPTKQRITLLAQKYNKDPNQLITYYEQMWKANYDASCKIMDTLCQKQCGVHYKEIPRVETERVRISK